MARHFQVTCLPAFFFPTSRPLAIPCWPLGTVTLMANFALSCGWSLLGNHHGAMCGWFIATTSERSASQLRSPAYL